MVKLADVDFRQAGLKTPKAKGPRRQLPQCSPSVSAVAAARLPAQLGAGEWELNRKEEEETGKGANNGREGGSVGGLSSRQAAKDKAKEQREKAQDLRENGPRGQVRRKPVAAQTQEPKKAAAPWQEDWKRKQAELKVTTAATKRGGGGGGVSQCAGRGGDGHF